LAQAKVSELDALKTSPVSLDSLSTYKNAVRYSDAATSGRLIQYNQDINQNLERLRFEHEVQIKRERDIAALKAEQNSVGEKLTAAVNKKKWIEEQIAQKQKHAKAPVDIKKLKNAARWTIASFALLYVGIISLGIASGIEPDIAEGPLPIFAVAVMALTCFLCARLMKVDNRTPHLTWINLPTGLIFSLVYSIAVLTKIKKGTIADRDADALISLNAQLEQVEADIENSRNQLSEIYSKLCELEK
jgi:septal ring factor EnvC (AmiA/AmiB activator)